LGLGDLMFCSGILAIGAFGLNLGVGALQTLAVVTLVSSSQAVLYAVRERKRLWSSRPSLWLIVSSIADLTIVATLASRGILMKPLPLALVGGVMAAAVLLALVLDGVKSAVFHRLKMT